MTSVRPVTTPFHRPIRLVVLISGGGTTLVNLQDCIQRGELSAEIPLVIASRADCGGIQKCRDRQLQCEVMTRKSFSSVDEFSETIFQRCRDVKADLILCGGFLALLKIPDYFQFRVMNIHPSIIPAFCGAGFHGHHVHEAVLKRGCKLSGCTVHFVDNEYDHGPIILQKSVPVLPDDTPDTLAARVFQAECAAYPEAIRQFAEGKLEITGNTVRIDS